ncbi:MAG TPA: hypothetical protein VMU89_02780 [Thermomicrobiaceae bacterium]|nr:hypothetical protein [Thermomicrobiaceae bacterium]
MAASATSQPNLYQQSGSGLHVSYATSGIDGKPHFTYQDVHASLSFSGDEIRRDDSDLGAVVSVSIRRTVDQGATTFSLLVPRVNLGTNQSAAILTLGITTIHRLSIVPALNLGQQDMYTMVRLRGTASLVAF